MRREAVLVMQVEVKLSQRRAPFQPPGALLERAVQVRPGLRRRLMNPAAPCVRPPLVAREVGVGPF